MKQVLFAGVPILVVCGIIAGAAGCSVEVPTWEQSDRHEQEKIKQEQAEAEKSAVALNAIIYASKRAVEILLLDQSSADTNAPIAALLDGPEVERSVALKSLGHGTFKCIWYFDVEDPATGNIAKVHFVAEVHYDGSWHLNSLNYTGDNPVPRFMTRPYVVSRLWTK
jgi:hypothetical protein